MQLFSEFLKRKILLIARTLDIIIVNAEILDRRAAVLEAMGAAEERIRAVREFAESERRVAAEWSSEAEKTAD